MNKEFFDNVKRMVVIPSTCCIVSQAIAWLYGRYALESWPHWRYVTAVTFPLLLCVSAFVVSNWRGWQKKQPTLNRDQAEQERRPSFEKFRLPPIPEEAPITQDSYTEAMPGKPVLYTGADGRQQMKLVAIQPVPTVPQWLPSTPANELTVIMGSPPATVLFIPPPAQPTAETHDEDDSLSGDLTRNEPYRKL